jgi:GTP-binding protein YchF
MKAGIIGYARSGKTTIFNALTGSHAEVGAFGSRDANVAVLKVPDVRLDRLAEIYKPKKVTFAEFQFVDIAPSDTSVQDKALSDAALRLLRNVDALVHVVRAFANENVPHPLGSIDPIRDCRLLEEELQLLDLIVIEKRLERLEKENRKDAHYQLLSRCKEHIESGASLRSLALAPHEEKELAGYGFLSQKPLLVLGNYGEESIGKTDPAGLATYAADTHNPVVDLCGAMELEVARLPEQERAAFRNELGLGEESRIRFLQAAYELLGLISFLTAGEPEVRAWTIRKGTRAVDAAGEIHSDIQRGFIRAEVIAYDDFISAGSMHKAKELGLVRLEGKDYIVKDGDIILFRFNV